MKYIAFTFVFIALFLCSCRNNQAGVTQPSDVQTEDTLRTITADMAYDQPTVTRIQERGTILIGTTGDYRPLSFHEADGSYWGFGIEVAEEMAKRLGVSIQFVPTSWPTLTADH